MKDPVWLGFILDQVVYLFIDTNQKPFQDKIVSKDTGRGKKIFNKILVDFYFYFKALSTSVIINELITNKFYRAYKELSVTKL